MLRERIFRIVTPDGAERILAYDGTEASLELYATQTPGGHADFDWFHQE